MHPFHQPPRSSLKSLKNLLKHQLLRKTPQPYQHQLIGNNRPLRVLARSPATPSKHHTEQIEHQFRSIEVSKEKLKKPSLQHQNNSQQASSTRLEKAERSRLNDGRTSRLVMPQILSKSPKDLRNPEMWRDISDEKIFVPIRKVNKQKRPNSIVLPKVKIVLSAEVYRTLDVL